MTTLPLIERELRSRSRSQGLYWTRFAVALAGLLFCLPMLENFGSLPGPSAATLGHSVFLGIIHAAFLLSCCAGFITVDRISRERREGTLGLLYLTDVTTFDILLGNFGAAGMACVCALLAFVPLVILPVLAGGVTGGEAFRSMLALLDTLLLSLATGLCASAGARGWLQSARTAGLLLLLLLTATFYPPLSFLSPATVLRMAGDAPYRFSPAPYWHSLAAVHSLSWLLLLTAGWRLRRALREGDAVTEAIRSSKSSPPAPIKTPGEVRPARAFALISWKIPYSKISDGTDPVRWLVRRQRGIKACIWVGTILWILPPSLLRLSLGFGFSINWAFFPSSGILTLLQGCLFAWAVSRFPAEKQRSGELELLMTTEVGHDTVVSGQWQEMKRLFTLPVIVILINYLWPTMVEIITRGSQSRFTQSAGWTLISSLIFRDSMYCLLVIARIAALIWTGLWYGLRARSQGTAIVRTVFFTVGVPYTISAVSSPFRDMVIASTRLRLRSSPTPAAVSLVIYLWPALSDVLNILYFRWLIRRAQNRLATDLRNPPEDFSFPGTIAEIRSKLASLLAKARRWPTPSAGE